MNILKTFLLAPKWLILTHNWVEDLVCFFIGIHCNDFCEIFQDYGTLLVTKTDNNEYLAPDRGQQVYSLYQAEGNELAIKAGKKRER